MNGLRTILSMTTTKVLDADGIPLVKGSRVEVDDLTGVVTTITDPDGDYDYELGRIRGINPKVTVLFDGGAEEDFTTSSMMRRPGDEERYRCDDLVTV